VLAAGDDDRLDAFPAMPRDTFGAPARRVANLPDIRR
jgi:hypothetical protein